jgi:pimeloyl-ACP methyl ester carboxylesterase
MNGARFDKRARSCLNTSGEIKSRPVQKHNPKSLHQVGPSDDLKLEIERRGRGPPLLLLPGEEALERDAPFLDELARSYEVIIPSPPGFGHSTRPDWITAPDDIAYMMLDIVDDLGLKNIPVVGFSFGGWIAAEMATKDDGFIAKLVLVGAYGVKTGKPTDREIADVWLIGPDEVAALKWHDAGKGKRDFPSMPEDELTIVARNNESFARFGWEPYLHNPKLRRRLHRIKAPTLLLWGANDGIVTPAYAEKYRSLIPGAKLSLIPQAGHLPHIEQPQAFVAELKKFLG